MWTAMPPTSSSRSSTSPVWIPVRTSRPSGRSASRIAPAHRIARADRRRSRTRRRRSSSRAGPRCRSICSRTARSCASSSSCQRWSPAAAARAVESTRSVNSTVASTRSGSTSAGAPVTNSSISAMTVSISPTTTTWSMPSSSTSRASARCSASQRDCRTLTARSPRRCSSSTGTRTLGITSRTSISRNIRKSPATMPGLAAPRSSRPCHSRAAGSSARVGEKMSMLAPVPQNGIMNSRLASPIASVVRPTGSRGPRSIAPSRPS